MEKESKTFTNILAMVADYGYVTIISGKRLKW